MCKILSRLSMIMNSLPLLFVLGALLLFAVGYGAHKIWGENNIVEELAEGLLRKEYNIDVEFSGRRGVKTC